MFFRVAEKMLGFKKHTVTLEKYKINRIKVLNFVEGLAIE